MTEGNSPKSCLGLGCSVLIAGAIAFTTAFAYGTSRYGWKIYLEIFSHFQVQYFVLVLILTSVLLLLRRRSFIGAGLLCCAVLSAQILPWYIPLTSFLGNSNAAVDVRVLNANVNTQNKSCEKVINLVKSETPDLAIFMEVDGF